ncbi:hypothetical protein PCANC_17198 [Puccinia coronata f. sp. avenae]|uniref:Uncharacterized protein n=1 Tax=Puccinia coronata f. sp. avenae TaxID=200324 RepID=A0A2N5U2A9_9BASI|nr:hypothetical protein PCANC_17198 [Puccinia coronata f. sp. avenae]
MPLNIEFNNSLPLAMPLDMNNSLPSVIKLFNLLPLDIELNNSTSKGIGHQLHNSLALDIELFNSLALDIELNKSMSKGIAEASELFNSVAKLGRQVFYSMAKLGQRAVQLGGQAWSASCSAWQSSLAIKFNTRWPSLATEFFNLATKLEATDVTSVAQTDFMSAGPTDTLEQRHNVSVGPANVTSVW